MNIKDTLSAIFDNNKSLEIENYERLYVDGKCTQINTIRTNMRDKTVLAKARKTITYDGDTVKAIASYITDANGKEEIVEKTEIDKDVKTISYFQDDKLYSCTTVKTINMGGIEKIMSTERFHGVHGAPCFEIIYSDGRYERIDHDDFIIKKTTKYNDKYYDNEFTTIYKHGEIVGRYITPISTVRYQTLDFKINCNNVKEKTIRECQVIKDDNTGGRFNIVLSSKTCIGDEVTFAKNYTGNNVSIIDHDNTITLYSKKANCVVTNDLNDHDWTIKLSTRNGNFELYYHDNILKALEAHNLKEDDKCYNINIVNGLSSSHIIVSVVSDNKDVAKYDATVSSETLIDIVTMLLSKVEEELKSSLSIETSLSIKQKYVPLLVPGTYDNIEEMLSTPTDTIVNEDTDQTAKAIENSLKHYDNIFHLSIE